jgi:PilZ domain
VVLTINAKGDILVRKLDATSLALEQHMAEAQQEKRAARRFALRIPVAVNRNGNSHHNESAEVRDVSARGICLYLDSPIEQGSPIGFTLTLPPEITLTESIRVQCKGHVVRTESGSGEGKIAAAAVIEEYEFLPES